MTAPIEPGHVMSREKWHEIYFGGQVDSAYGNILQRAHMGTNYSHALSTDDPARNRPTSVSENIRAKAKENASPT